MKEFLGKLTFPLIILAIIFFPAYAKIQKLTMRDKVLSQKVEKLKLENERLLNENELLRTDPVYIEEMAREKLKVARDNEVIFRIINEGEE